MSVLNIHFTPDRVNLLSDTLTYSGGRPFALCKTKVHVAPSGRFAWSTRGLCWLGDIFDPIAARCSTFDEAEVAALAWIESLSDDDLDGSRGLDLTLAGYSTRAADLVVLTLDREAGRPVQSTVYPRGVYLLPTSRNIPPLPATVSEAQFVQLALAQHRVGDRLKSFGGDGLCIGGCGMITTVSRTSASQRIAFLYPGYAEHAAEFGDPNARAAAAFLGAPEAAAA